MLAASSEKQASNSERVPNVPLFDNRLHNRDNGPVLEQDGFDGRLKTSMKEMAWIQQVVPAAEVSPEPVGSRQHAPRDGVHCDLTMVLPNFVPIFGRVLGIGSVEKGVGGTKGSPDALVGDDYGDGTLCFIKIPTHIGLLGGNAIHQPRSPERLAVGSLAGVHKRSRLLPKNHVRDVELERQGRVARRLGED